MAFFRSVSRRQFFGILASISVKFSPSYPQLDIPYPKFHIGDKVKYSFCLDDPLDSQDGITITYYGVIIGKVWDFTEIYCNIDLEWAYAIYYYDNGKLLRDICLESELTLDLSQP